MVDVERGAHGEQQCLIATAAIDTMTTAEATCVRSSRARTADDGSTRQTQGRGERDDWSRDNGPSPDEFRGDRSYQNAMEEERWRGEGGGQSQFRSSDEGGNFRSGGRRFNSDVDRNDWSSSSDNYGGSRGGQFGGHQSFSGRGESGYGQSGYNQSGYGQGNSGRGGYGQSGYSSGRSQMTERYGNQSGSFQGGRSGEWFSGDGRSQPGDNQWHPEQSQWQPGSQQGTQGMQQRGQHYGKGPKGYSRSDDRIKEDLSDRMMTHPDLDASDIDMDINQGEVTLRGSVDSRQSRRLAEDLCEDCHGVRQVNNQLRVNDRSQSMSGGRNSSDTGDGTTSTNRNRSDKSDKSEKSDKSH